MNQDAEDFSQPILTGEAASDYERYLRTDDLLALQKTSDEQAHRDELLFQTVHQASELWLKLAWTEAEEEHFTRGLAEPVVSLTGVCEVEDSGWCRTHKQYEG